MFMNPNGISKKMPVYLCPIMFFKLNFFKIIFNLI